MLENILANSKNNFAYFSVDAIPVWNSFQKPEHFSQRFCTYQTLYVSQARVLNTNWNVLWNLRWLSTLIGQLFYNCEEVLYTLI